MTWIELIALSYYVTGIVIAFPIVWSKRAVFSRSFGEGAYRVSGKAVLALGFAAIALWPVLVLFAMPWLVREIQKAPQDKTGGGEG